MTTLPLADISVLVPFVKHVKHYGGNPNPILEQCSIPRGMIHTGMGKISKVQLYRCVENLARDTGTSDLGYRVGKEFTAENMGHLGSAFLQSSSLYDALITLQRYVSVWVEGTTVKLLNNGDDILLIDQCHGGFDPDRKQTNQATISFMRNLVRTVAGASWNPRQVMTECLAPSAAAPPAEFQDAEFRHHSSYNAIAIPKHLLSLPMPKRNPANRPPIDLPKTAPFQEQLKQIITGQLTHGTLLNANQAAEISGVSTRTLQRQLANDGINYRHLLDRVRYEVAVPLLLASPPQSIEEIARLLHYSGANNFSRAFKRISSQTPKAFKQTRST